jgi:hypothetical protein
VKEPAGWQLEMVFLDHGSVPKFGFFGQLYTRVFNRSFYRNSSQYSNTLMYSLPMPRLELEHWGVRGFPLISLGVLGGLMRPESSLLEKRFRRMVWQARASSKPLRQAISRVLLAHGIPPDEMRAEWGHRPRPDQSEWRQVACRLNILHPVPATIRQAVLEAAKANAASSLELTWLPFTPFDLEEIRDRVQSMPHAVGTIGT